MGLGEEKKAKKPNPAFAREVVDAGAETLNLCFQCGTCTGSCPSGKISAFRTRKLIRRAQLGLREDVLPSDELWFCTTCYTCFERCPRGVDVPNILFVLRNMAVREGYMSDAHRKTAGYLLETGHMVPLTDKYKQKRVKLGLSAVPPTTLSSAKDLEEVKNIMKKTGFDRLIKKRREK